MVQSYRNIEHIVVDGASTDETMKIVREYEDHIDVIVSEHDDGLWDAMNKGIAIAQGDIIGFLNSDDVFANGDVLRKIADVVSGENIDAAFGFVDLVDRKVLNRTVRRYRVSRVSRLALAFGLMPAHPTLYCRRQLFESCGGFIVSSDIVPDFELVVRFLTRGKMRARLIPEVLVKMRTGGASNASNVERLLRNRLLVESCRRNGVRSSSAVMWLKWPYRIWEYLRPA